MKKKKKWVRKTNVQKLWCTSFGLLIILQKNIVDEQSFNFCAALVAKLVTCLENLIAKCFFTHY